MAKRSRASNSNLYQRGAVYYGHVTVNGRKFRKSLQTTDRGEAERRLTRWLAQLSPYHGNTQHTFAEAVVIWWGAHAGQWKPKTEEGYRKILAVLDKHFGELFWHQIDKARLLGFMADRRAEGASAATINRNLSVISGIANVVREFDDWPDLNPVEHLPRRQRKEKRMPFIRPSEACIERVFARMHGTFGDLARFALLTGMRKDEVAYLQRHHCRDGEVQISDQKNMRGISVIPICDEAQAIIDRQPPTNSPYVFVTNRGGPYKRVTEMWREVMLRTQKMTQTEGVAFTPFRFHDLRHEFAIRYLKSGGSLYALQKILRHSTIGQTEWYLTFLTPDQAAKSKL